MPFVNSLNARPNATWVAGKTAVGGSDQGEVLLERQGEDDAGIAGLKDVTAIMLEQAAQHDFIRAVVGWADLADPRVGEILTPFGDFPTPLGLMP